MTAQTDDGIEHTPARSRLASVFGLVGSSLGAIFLAGASVGFFSAHDPSRPLSTVGLLVGAGLVGGTVLCLWLAARTVLGLSRSARSEIVAPSVRKGRTLTVLSGLLGAAIAVIMLIGQPQGFGAPAFSIFSDAPMQGWAAIALIALTCTALPWITWAWHRAIDEHEFDAYREGALYGLYAYSLISFCWWLGARAALLPSVDGVAVFFATYTVWGAVWLWKRYR
ncbi:MAG: hypothetical protein H6916_14825 [Novosphingobium sp.]|uniref:hypothetical protein n=1 Tax=Novosphingobium sp. TaxID=1874826 RepID=UPI001DFB795B|nr:hypothetical protein [Novosphingobium sp.]MCB2056949.1 hypothetical protein [Novosphingobium sp.]MCP5388065.1 hypothetical protein [Novosphingobium sp.]